MDIRENKILTKLKEYDIILINSKQQVAHELVAGNTDF